MTKFLQRPISFQKLFIIGVTALLLLSTLGYGVIRVIWRPAWVENDPAKAFSRFVTQLPEVDAVSISRLAYHSPTNQQKYGERPYWGESEYMVVTERPLMSEAALEFSKLWRSMPEQKYIFTMCHEPIYGLRFSRNDKVIFETTFCWKCNNISMLSSKGEYYIDFDKRSPHAKSLWKLMQEYVPLEASAGTQP